MAKDIKQCPFCAEDIKVEANVCKHCGRNLQAPTAGSSQDKKPIIGFVGMILLGAGVLSALCAGPGWLAWAMLISGAFVLGYALLTGNIKLLG